MSWIELDDHILDHPKFIRVAREGGGDAVFLWLGLRAYCSQNLSDGFIPTDMFDEVRGPKNPRARERSMRVLMASGLVHVVADGYRMHDYLQWSSSKEQVLARRETARERKRRSRGGPGGSHGGGHAVTGGRTHGGTDGGVNAESQTPARAFSSASAPSPATAAAADEPILCPPDLSLTEAQIGTLEIGGVQRWAVKPLTARFVSKAILDTNPKTLTTWRKMLSSAVSGGWNDPGQRPKKPVAEAPDEDAEMAARFS